MKGREVGTEVYQRFRGVYCLCHQGAISQKVSKNLAFGLYPSSNVFFFKNNVSEAGCASVFRLIKRGKRWHLLCGVP
jgi:hypothetical protein